MAQPTSRDLRPIDPLLTNMSIGFRNDRFFYDLVAPMQVVPQPSGQFTVWESEYWFRRQEGSDRGSHAPYVRVGYEVGYDNYRTSEIGFEKLLADPDVAASQLPENLEAQDVAFITNLMQMELEGRTVESLFTTGVWGTDKTLSGTNQWSDLSMSDPIQDVYDAITKIREMTGVPPNRMFMGQQVWKQLKEHPDITEKYKYTQTGIMTPQLVAAVLDIPELYIGDTVEVKGAENRGSGATYARTKVWGPHALITVNNTPQLGVANGAYNFVWDEKGNVPWAIENYREESVRATINRIFTHFTTKVVSKEHGYFIKNAVA